MVMNSKSVLQVPTSRDGFLILVADDDRGMRRMLRLVMEAEGYQVIEAADGRECLEHSRTFSPDLLLLDALMPGLDGFEVCEQLQKLPAAQRPTVLMVTSLENHNSVDRAFQVGVDDFITKPINWAVLRQRVRRMLNSRQVEKLRDDLIRMIVHDMKSPLSAISGHLEMLLESLWGDLNPNQHDSVLRAYRNTQTLLDMTMMILDLQRLEEGKLTLHFEPAPVLAMLHEVVTNLDWMAQNYGVEIAVECTDSQLFASLDWNVLQRVLTNLISNAIKHSPRGSMITIAATSDADKLFISVKDQGEGIALEDQLFIFEKYSQASQRKGGSRTDTGLGLTFCKLAVEAHGGWIELESKLSSGSTFTLVLPIQAGNQEISKNYPQS
jgi:two-component system, sensor histidine kinase and response regulator